MKIEKIINKIYKRRQKAHEDLLVCDLELDELLKRLVGNPDTPQ